MDVNFKMNFSLRAVRFLRELLAIALYAMVFGIGLAFMQGTGGLILCRGGACDSLGFLVAVSAIGGSIGGLYFIGIRTNLSLIAFVEISALVALTGLLSAYGVAPFFYSDMLRTLIPSIAIVFALVACCVWNIYFAHLTPWQATVDSHVAGSFLGRGLKILPSRTLRGAFEMIAVAFDAVILGAGLGFLQGFLAFGMAGSTLEERVVYGTMGALVGGCVAVVLVPILYFYMIRNTLSIRAFVELSALVVAFGLLFAYGLSYCRAGIVVMFVTPIVARFLTGIYCKTRAHD